MHPRATVRLAFELAEQGLGRGEISRRLNVHRATIGDWLAGRLPRSARADTCPRCGHVHSFKRLTEPYVYLLGLYLGDGSISAHARDVFRLRIFLDIRYPLIIDDRAAAIAEVVPQNRVHRLEQRGNYVVRDQPSMVVVSAFSKSWPCLFPQHGPGRKHEREIALATWQLELVAKWPEQLLRGLIQSDGSRFMNTGRRGWSAPRYEFSNKSDDIRAIFCDACDAVGLRWTRSGRESIYVSRKADVSKLDEFIGPKR